MALALLRETPRLREKQFLIFVLSAPRPPAREERDTQEAAEGPTRSSSLGPLLQRLDGGRRQATAPAGGVAATSRIHPSSSVSKLSRSNSRRA